MRKRKFINDSIKTISSSLLVAFGLQLLAYPFIINKIGNDKFGEILTIYTLITLISVVTGNTLNNIRLINTKFYNPDFFYKVFIKLLIISMILESILLLIVLIMYFDLKLTSIFVLIVINILMCLRIYLVVFYRMKLEYNKIFLVSIFQFTGVLFGLFIFYLINIWELIFLFSEVFSITYIIYTLKVKGLFKSIDESVPKLVIKDYLYLLSTNFLNNIVLYLDRLILLPLLGGTAVTIAYLSTFIGKIIASFLYPINNVILSYISVTKTENKSKQYIIVVIIGSILSCLVLIICYPITIFIVEKIYMQDINKVKNFIIIGNLAILVGFLCNMIQSLNIKYIELRVQSIFQIVHSILFILITMILTVKYGIFGFFISTLLGNLVKMLSLLIIGYKFSNSKEIVK